MRLARSWRRSGAACVFLASALLLLGTPASATETGWLQVDVDGLTLYGNAEAKELTRLADDLQRFQHRLEQASSGMEVYSPVPTHLYVFRNDETFDKFSRGADGKSQKILGYFQQGRDGNYVVVNAAFPEETRKTIYHEYLHYFVSNNLQDIPLWLNEGLAEYYSTFISLGKDAELGHRIDRHTTWLASRDWIPLADLLRIDNDSSAYHGDLAPSFYAQSWAIVHWVMVGDRSQRHRMNQLLGLLGSGMSSRRALAQTLGLETAQLEEDLRSYVKRISPPFSRYHFSRWSFPERLGASNIHFRPMQKDEVLARLGDLMAHRHEHQFTEADTLLAQALAINSANALAEESLAQLRIRQERWDEAIESAERAVAIDGERVRARSLAAWAMLGASAANADSVESVQLLIRSRDHLRSCIQKDPTNHEHRRMLGQTYLGTGNGNWEGLSALTQVFQLLPGRLDVLADLITLTAEAGNLAGARSLFETRLKAHGTSDDIKQAMFAIEKAEVTAITKLLESPDDTMPDKLREMSQMSKSLEVKKWISSLIESFTQRESAKSDPDIVRYEAAVDLLNDGDWDAALPELIELSKNAKDPILRYQAEEAAIWLQTRIDFSEVKDLVRSGKNDAALTIINRLRAGKLDKELQERVDQFYRLLSN